MGCGCNDTPCKGKTTPCPPMIPCDRPECEEYHSMQCVAYTGVEIPYLNIKYGDRMDEVVQKLIQAITNFSAADNPGNFCKAVYAIRTGTLTSTSIQLFWTQPDADLSYQVEYKLPDDVDWTSLEEPVTEDNATITGLDPETFYYIRIRTICNAGEALSITVVVNTLPATT